MNNTYYLSKNMLNMVKEIKLRDQLKEYTSAFNKLRHNQSLKIGVMGKSGAGKSTIINSFCQEYVCETGGSGGVTRDIQEIKGKLGDMSVMLVDFPGIAENQKWNKKYLDDYEKYLDELDMIFWAIKVDDRAIMEDEQFYNEHIALNWDLRKKFIFILSQSDKAEPQREWNNSYYTPSSRQEKIIKKNHIRIANDFNTEYGKVIPVASNYIKGEQNIKLYNFDSIFESILFKLNAMSAISSEVSFQLSWDVTQRETDKELKMSDFAYDEVSQELDDLRSSLKSRFANLL